MKQLVYPLPLALLLILLGVLLFWRRRRALATTVTAIAVLGLYLLSTPAVSDSLRGALERRFRPDRPDHIPRAGAIVVLGGGIEPATPPQRTANLTYAADRIRFGAALYRAGKAPLVITTGRRPYANAGPTAAQAAAGFLEELGVPKDAIVAAGDSADTHEDAIVVQGALARHDVHKILLVTSALHMPRAYAVFRKADIDAVPVVTDIEVTNVTPDNIYRWLPDARAFYGSNRAWHEYVGLLYYRLEGWI